MAPKQQVEVVLCKAIVKTSGKPCTCKALKGQDFCGKHSDKKESGRGSKVVSPVVPRPPPRSLSVQPVQENAPRDNAVDHAPMQHHIEHIEKAANALKENLKGVICKAVFDSLHNLLVLNEAQKV